MDEVFADYALEPPADRLRTALGDTAPPCPVFVLSGLSKVAALPQVKLGWIAVRGPGAAEHLEPLAFLADQYLSVSAPVQAAAPGPAGPGARIREQVPSAPAGQPGGPGCGAWRSIPHLSRLPVEGGWSVLLRRPAVDGTKSAPCACSSKPLSWCIPGSFFDLTGDGYLVLSLLTPEETFQDGLNRIFPCL